MAKECAIPEEVRAEIVERVEKFNKEYLSKETEQYIPEFKGKFIYLKRVKLDGYCDPICRLTYDGALKNMHFAMYRFSNEKYDDTADAFFDAGTLEKAMKVGLEVYPIENGFVDVGDIFND